MFGAGFFGDFDEDPIFGAQLRSFQQMNNMMNSFLGDTFGMATQSQGRGGHMAMQPFGFRMPISSMIRMPSIPDGPNPNMSHSYSSSSFMSMTPGPNGTPVVYREEQSTVTGPGGVRETKKTVDDSRTGTKKMAIGHHIGERSHILEREKNFRSGEEEERQEFINLDEEEADEFNREWTSKTQARISGSRRNREMPAITAAAAPSSKKRAIEDGGSKKRSMEDEEPKPNMEKVKKRDNNESQTYKDDSRSHKAHKTTHKSKK